tara:strand:- start:874 stop:1059 length:186 start_codon:yes stop_codon:yes gene_type:complete
MEKLEKRIIEKLEKRIIILTLERSNTLLKGMISSDIELPILFVEEMQKQIVLNDESIKLLK